MDDVSKKKVYPGLSSPKVSVTYGNKNIDDIIANLIILEMTQEIKYNEDTKLMFKGDTKNAKNKKTAKK